MDVVIVHFNTPELTTATVRSIWKHTPGCRITIFDNSNKRPFPPIDGVFVIDNTKNQLIDFDKMLEEFPDKVEETINGWASARHCKTIDYLWDMFPSGFVLMDSDVLVKKDFSDLVDLDAAYSGEVYQDLLIPPRWVPRVLPFICWINVPLCRKAGIRYFDGKRNWKLYPGDYTTWYDTGGSFYEDCANKRLPCNKIVTSDYVEHLGAASYYGGKNKDKWLEKFKELYE